MEFRQFLEMANRWIPKITDPETQLEYIGNCTSRSCDLNLLSCMDDNNDWQPTLKTRRFLEKFVGAMKDDYALRFKYCLYKGQPYVAAYFSGIHYVFKATSSSMLAHRE